MKKSQKAGDDQTLEEVVKIKQTIENFKTKLE
jgi:hypothetical protein